MSSDSSVTTSSEARVRQFGLYRTIDAKTEEFLRLSKRRQIRQGCACAAVSTAITVTVVVSILLVYAYGGNSQSNLNNKHVTKPNWFAWINDSADTTPFEEKYSKLKLSLDKTSVKLLPLLLKVLNQNRHLDKIIDEYETSSPKYEGKDSSEYSYSRNGFTDVRNLYKMPTSRLYAIEYKASPVVYYRSPAKSVEYFTKIRKIRDYQRILNYFDKMIGEKATLGTSLSTLKKDLYKTEKPSIKQTTTAMRNPNIIKNLEASVTTNKNMKHNDKHKTGCTCPKILGEMLSKLVSSVAQLLPYTKLPIVELCKQQKTLKEKSKSESMQDVVTKKITINKPTTALPYLLNPAINLLIKTINTEKFNGNNEPNRILENKVVHFPLTINIFKPPKEKLKDINDHSYSFSKSTTVKNYIDPTDNNQNTLTATKPLNTIRKHNNIDIFLDQTTAENVYNPEKITIRNKTLLSKSTIFTEEEYEDYFVSTQNAIHNFDALDAHSLGLVKTKMISPVNKFEKNKNKFNELTRTHKNNSQYNTQDSKLDVVKLKHTFNDSDGREFDNNILPKITPKRKSESLIFETQNITETNTVKNITNIPTSLSGTNNRSKQIYKIDQLLNTGNTILDEDKTLQEDEFQEEDNTRPLVKPSTTFNETVPDNVQEPFYKTFVNEKSELTKNKENSPTSNLNSMLPENRPMYLKIQRNVWRQGDQHDFDTSFNNNLFDIPSP